MTLLKLIYSE